MFFLYRNIICLKDWGNSKVCLNSTGIELCHGEEQIIPKELETIAAAKVQPSSDVQEPVALHLHGFDSKPTSEIPIVEAQQLRVGQEVIFTTDTSSSAVTRTLVASPQHRKLIEDLVEPMKNSTDPEDGAAMNNSFPVVAAQQSTEGIHATDFDSTPIASASVPSKEACDHDTAPVNAVVDSISTEAVPAPSISFASASDENFAAISILDNGVEYIFDGITINSTTKTEKDIHSILSELPGFPFVFLDDYQGVHPRMRRDKSQAADYYPYCKVYESLRITNQVLLLWEESVDTTTVEKIGFNILRQLVDNRLLWILGTFIPPSIKVNNASQLLATTSTLLTEVPVVQASAENSAFDIDPDKASAAGYNSSVPSFTCTVVDELADSELMSATCKNGSAASESLPTMTVVPATVAVYSSSNNPISESAIQKSPSSSLLKVIDLCGGTVNHDDNNSADEDADGNNDAGKHMKLLLYTITTGP